MKVFILIRIADTDNRSKKSYRDLWRIIRRVKGFFYLKVNFYHHCCIRHPHHHSTHDPDRIMRKCLAIDRSTKFIKVKHPLRDKKQLAIG
jgi:hypothetical protein